MSIKDENYFFSTYQQIITNKDSDFLVSLTENIELKNLLKPLLRKVSHHLWKTLKGEPFSDFTSLKYQSLNQKFLRLTSKSAIDKVYKHQPEWQNALNDAISKFLRRLFLSDGHNDESYVFQSNIQEWLANMLADIIAQDKRFQSIKVIERVLPQAEMLHGFYTQFLTALPSAIILEDADEWTSIIHNESFFRNAIYTFSKDYFENYELNWQKTTDKEQYKTISKATQYSEYGHLSEKYGFRNFILLKKSLKNWVIFWDNLLLPLLQDMALMNNSSVYDILAIAKLITSKQSKFTSSKKQLAFILLKNYFSKSHKSFSDSCFLRKRR